MMHELALTESPSLRAQYAGRVDVLDKVKALSLLPDDIHATTEMVARYFEVDIEVIKKAVQRHREELASNGMTTLRGDELRDFKHSAEGQGVPLPKNLNALSLFTRRAILNIGQLLTESTIARQIRTYLLDVEELSGPDVRSEALERATLGRAQVLMLKAADGLLDHDWIVAKTKVVVARGLGEEPEIDPDDMPLYVPDFLKSKGLTGSEVRSVQSWFGRRVAALYEAEHGDKPGKRIEETPTGSIRETIAWTKRDLPLFEEVWQRWYAADYPQTPEILSLIPS